MPGHEEQRREGRFSVIFFVLSISLILAATLYPFRFAGSEQGFPGVLIIEKGRVLKWDIIQNVLLFIPFGMGISMVARSKRRSWFFVLPLALSASLGLSYTVEVIQAFMPRRYSTLTDVLSNGGGGVAGALLFFAWERAGRPLTLWIAEGLFDRDGEIRRFSPGVWWAIVLLYGGVAFALSIFFLSGARLANWSSSYRLNIGNEQTGERQWRGRIFQLAIADRALNAGEVESILAGGEENAPVSRFLVASYRFGGSESFEDRTGNVPILSWKGGAAEIGEGVFLDSGRWLQSRSAPASLTKRIMRSSRFTIVTRVAAEDSMQGGPARIVSLSRNTWERNFTLGQHGDALVFRLRTPLTGRNGALPELVVPGVFSMAGAHRAIAVTYNGSSLRVSVDGERRPETLELAPWNIPFSYIQEKDSRHLVAVKLFYYALLFFPAGILMAVFRGGMRNSSGRLLAAAVGILILPLIHETVFVVIQGRPTIAENLVLGGLVTVCALASAGLPLFALQRFAARRGP